MTDRTEVRPVQKERPGKGGHGWLEINVTRTRTEQVTCEQIEAVLAAALRGYPDIPDGVTVTAEEIAGALREMRLARTQLEVQVARLATQVGAEHAHYETEHSRYMQVDAKLERIRRAHRRAGNLDCDGDCGADDDDACELSRECVACGQMYPCWTTRVARGTAQPAEDERAWQRPVPDHTRGIELLFLRESNFAQHLTDAAYSLLVKAQLSTSVTTQPDGRTTVRLNSNERAAEIAVEALRTAGALNEPGAR